MTDIANLTTIRVADDWEVLYDGETLVYQHHDVRIQDLNHAAKGRPMLITELYSEAIWPFTAEHGCIPDSMSLTALKSKITELEGT